MERRVNWWAWEEIPRNRGIPTKRPPSWFHYLDDWSWTIWDWTIGIRLKWHWLSRQLAQTDISCLDHSKQIFCFPSTAHITQVVEVLTVVYSMSPKAEELVLSITQVFARHFRCYFPTTLNPVNKQNNNIDLPVCIKTIPRTRNRNYVWSGLIVILCYVHVGRALDMFVY